MEPIDDYQVFMAKLLIDRVVMPFLQFPQPIIVEALRQKLEELEQEESATSRWSATRSPHQ